MNIIKSYFQNLSYKKIILILLSLGILIYANSLLNSFIADDIPQIIQNPLVHSILKMPDLFSQSTAYAVNDIQRSNFYRPLLSTTYALIYFFSGSNPFGFHLMQILLHVTNSILLFLIFSYFFRKGVSFFLALIFLVHPFNTEAVIYISNLQDILFVLFGLIALYFIAKRGKKHLAWLGITLLVMSLLSKETGILFILIIPFFIYLYDKKNITRGLLQSFTALLIYLFLRLAIAHLFFPKLTTSPIMTLSFMERAINIPKIILFYLKTFFYPKDLLIFQTWTVKSLNFLDFYIPLIIEAVILGLLLLFGIIVYKKNIGLFKILFFFLGWFVVGLSFHLQIIPLDQTVADRWFYFPMIGLLGLIGVIVTYFNLSKSLGSNISILIVFVIVILLSTRVIVRNTNWKDEFTLFTHDIKYNRDSFQLEQGLGFVYSLRGNTLEAEQHYLRASTLFPSWNIFQSLGIFYLKNNKYKQAENSFYTALKYDSDLPYGWLLLGVVKYKLGNKEGAVSAVSKAYSIAQSKSFLRILKTIEEGKEFNIQYQ